jgi:predicted nucleotidyltransferase
MKDLEKELRNLSQELSKLQKQGELKGYSLIGALAVAARARPRATKDIDFLVSADRDFFFKTFPEILKKKGYELKVFKGEINDPVNGLIRIYDKGDKTELADIIPVLWNWQDEIIMAAEKIKVFDVPIPVARIEDLIVLKLKAGGPQDMIDAEELAKAAKISKKIDLERIQSLAERAKVSKRLKTLLLNFGITA